jgi:hypothetical protein
MEKEEEPHHPSFPHGKSRRVKLHVCKQNGQPCAMRVLQIPIDIQKQEINQESLWEI